MPPHIAKFLAFGLFGVFALAAGYVARRRNWLHEDRSRTIHYYTVVWLWSAALLLSLWRIPPLTENLWLVAIQPLLMAAGAYGIIPLAKLIGCKGQQLAVIALAAGLSNNGFGMGAYLCFSILHPPEEALAYGLAFASITNAAMVPLLYPLARLYSPATTAGESFARLLVRSYLDARAMPMYAALVGVALAIAQVPFPAAIDTWYVIDILAYAGAFGGYFGIGLRLHIGGSAAYLKQHILLAAVKFTAIPLAAVAILWAIHLTAHPLGPVASQVARIESAMPSAVVMVALANMFHLDARFASTLWAWNMLLFMLVPLPVVLWLFV